MYNITLETAIYLSGTKNNLAIGVEQCQCSSMYNGTSCQNPAHGYYRYKEMLLEDNQQLDYDHFIGKAIPCKCNDRSNQCDIETGYCEVNSLCVAFHSTF